jgi:hypothetical protein
VRSEMKLVINGADVELDGRYAKTPLPWVLRDVGLHGTKFGCGAGFCAAHTVLIDGRKHEVLLDRDRAGGGQGNHHSRGASGPVADAAAFEGGQRGIEAVRYTSSEKVDPLRRRIDSGTGVSGALTMPATSLQAAAEEVVKRDPGLTPLIPHIIPSASLFI